ncbi:MAG: nucleotidyl transferase AbiEii/AbiGii toxin family protein [Candidatus Omnitrophica bacterium]|nr:nucleotidyl transferase AbiEii/AbiGii toxin family protein [Candidatus Omnitrophota bacterium]
MKEYLNQIIKQHPDILIKRSIVREYLQARILQSMQDSKAFLNMAFVGGTVMRFLYSMPRYSEDLDFSLLPSKKINFDKIVSNIKRDFEAEDYNITIKVQDKKPVINAFINFSGLLYELNLSPHKNEVISVKIEIDTNPPQGASTSATLIRRYVLINILHYDKASLFAGKLHAILNRKYTKGRDIFDLVWMLADPSWPTPNFILLNKALHQTKWKGPKINNKNWKNILAEHIKKIRWEIVIDDVFPFLERQKDRNLLTQKNLLSLLGSFRS